MNVESLISMGGCVFIRKFGAGNCKYRIIRFLKIKESASFRLILMNLRHTGAQVHYRSFRDFYYDLSMSMIDAMKNSNTDLEVF
jgi:hypothetical protein